MVCSSHKPFVLLFIG